MTVDQQRLPLSFAVDADGCVRVLYTVIDSDGVHFGDTTVDVGRAPDYLNAAARAEGIRAVFICITETARYGDAVQFYAAIDKTRYFVSSIPTYRIPGGYRLPLRGEFRRAGASWIDAKNRQELL